MTETSVPRGLNGAMARRLDIERARDALGDRVMLGGIAQQVPHLQHAPFLLCQGGKTVGLRQRCSHRFFDQHVTLAFERYGREIEMRLGRCCDDDGIRRREQHRQRQAARAALGSERIGAGLIDIRHAGQNGALRRRNLARVEAAEMPGADDADTQSCRQDQLPA